MAGLAGKTNNASPEMGMVIGGLWQKYFGEVIYQSVGGKVNEKTLGIYTDFESDETGDYTIMVACEMDLPRAYVCDFEEYQNGNMEDAEIHVYIGLYELMIYDDLLGFIEVYWGYGVFCWHARTFWIIAQLYSGGRATGSFCWLFSKWGTDGVRLVFPIDI